jgi:hypothetical protein
LHEKIWKIEQTSFPELPPNLHLFIISKQKLAAAATTTSHHNAAQHHGTITHLVLDLLHRLELFYGKQQTSRRNEMRDIE